jgi:hypothetical protein
MSQELAKKLIDEVLSTIEYSIKDNKCGLSEIGGDYWLGRLFQSEQFKKELDEIIFKHTK